MTTPYHHNYYTRDNREQSPPPAYPHPPQVWSSNHPKPRQKQHNSFTWAADVHRFFSEVSMSGMRFLVSDDSPLVRKIIWAVLVLSGVSVMCYHIGTQITFFFTYPTAVNLVYVADGNRSVGGLQFPTVTLCDDNFLNKGEMTDEEKEMFLAAFPFPDPEDRIDKSILDTYDFTTKDFLDVLKQHTSLWGSMLIACQFNGKSCNGENLWQYFKRVVTDYGLCFQFNPNGTLKSDQAGKSAGLYMLVNAQEEEYIANPSGALGYTFLMHSPDDVPFVDNLGTKVTTGRISQMELKTREVVNLPPPHGECAERDLRYYDSFSPSRCQMECITNYTIQQCDCKRFFMPKEAPRNSCTPVQETNCVKPKLREYYKQNLERHCNCPVPCKQVVYSSSLSVSKISPMVSNIYQTALNESNDFIERNICLIYIYFGTTSFERVETVEAYNMFSLFCDIGGAMGLVLASSFLTLFEFIDFFLMHPVRVYKHAVKTPVHPY